MRVRNIEHRVSRCVLFIEFEYLNQKYLSYLYEAAFFTKISSISNAAINFQRKQFIQIYHGSPESKSVKRKRESKKEFYIKSE